MCYKGGDEEIEHGMQFLGVLCGLLGEEWNRRTFEYQVVVSILGIES